MSDDLVKRLRERAAEDRQIQANNEAVATALMGQRLLFDQGIRSPANTFAVRLGFDYEECAKNDAKLAADWDAAAARIAELEAQVAKLVEAVTDLDRAASEVARRGAVTGPQWSRLTIASLKARATLPTVKQDTPTVKQDTPTVKQEGGE